MLFSSFADVWETAGGRVDITVGESVERGFAPEDVLLVDDGAGKTINQELLLSYEPDFVICSADLEEQGENGGISAQAGSAGGGIPCGGVSGISGYAENLHGYHRGPGSL